MTGPLSSSIQQVEDRIVRIPLKRPIGTKYVFFENTYFLLLRVTDSDGVSGYSGLWCFTPDLPGLFHDVCRWLAKYLIDRSLDERGAMFDVLEGVSGFVGRTGLSVFARSACGMAVDDLWCRRLGVSLADLLGKRRTHVGAYKTGLFLSFKAEELAAETKRANEEGFRALKMWIGSADLAEDLERIQIVRDAAAPGTKIMLDASQAWNLPEATRALEAIAAHEPVWLEDPLPYRELEALREVARRSPVPIATGENAYRPDSFRPLLDAGVQYLEPDLQRLGGIREWNELAAMAATYGAVVVPHCYGSVALQLGAATPQAETWIEYVPWWETIFAHPLAAVDGMIEVPSTPGIGFELDHDVVDDLALGDWEVIADTSPTGTN